MSGIVEGKRWVQARRQYLQGLLDAGPEDDQRGAIEAELATLQAEARRHHRGWRRWLHLPGRTHDL